MTTDVRWDLGPLYAGPDDPVIARDEAEVDRKIEAFQSHRDRLSGPNVRPEEVAGILEDYEAIRFLQSRLGTYAGLAACADQSDPRLAALFARQQEKDSRWSAQTLFVELGLRRLPVATLDRIAKSPACARYRHFVRYQAALARHTLSEAEEQIILKKNIAGRDAQVRFREEFAARLEFGVMTVDGREQKMTMALLAALQEHRDPEVRLQARTRLLETYRTGLPIFTFLYQGIVKDHGVEAELRGFPEPIEVENVPNEIPGHVVKALLAAGRKYLPVMRDYFAWKREKLGLPRMRTSDLLAPLPGASEETIPWSASRDLVERSFARLDPMIATEVGRFFAEERIDAGARGGKRQGAFCAPVPGGHPYILMSYTDNLSSLVTLAHELGHGVHFTLSGESQTLLQAYQMSKVVAETASEFGECLLRDQLLESSDDRSLRLKILAGEVERFISVVFRQLLFTEFELKVHDLAAREPLTADGLCDLWEDLTREYYGPDIDLLDCDRLGWTMVGHFVFSPFYCYSYALSQVVVLALYRRWKQDGADFLPRYLELLRGGASGSPTELLGRAGIDLRGPTVLEEAFMELDERVREVKAVTA